MSTIFDNHTDWSQAATGIGVVIHLVGKAHVMHEISADHLASYWHINTEGTARFWFRERNT